MDYTDHRYIDRTCQIIERILHPNLQDKALQMAILDFRARYPISPMSYTRHHCPKHSCGGGGIFRLYHKIDPQGCSRCRKIPEFTCNQYFVPGHSGSLCFELRDWNIWVRALLASDDDVDKELGRKIRSDHYFEGWIRDDATGTTRIMSRLTEPFAGIKSLLQKSDRR